MGLFYFIAFTFCAELEFFNSIKLVQHQQLVCVIIVILSGQS